MAPKLKTYQAALGFFDMAIAAPSMKAALEAWGSNSNLFHQGLAKQTDDPDVVAAITSKPGVILRRPIGSHEPFEEEAAVPGRLPSCKKKHRRSTVSLLQTPKAPLLGKLRWRISEKSASVSSNRGERKKRRQRIANGANGPSLRRRALSTRQSESMMKKQRKSRSHAQGLRSVRRPKTAVGKNNAQSWNMRSARHVVDAWEHRMSRSGMNSWQGSIRVP